MKRALAERAKQSGLLNNGPGLGGNGGSSADAQQSGNGNGNGNGRPSKPNAGEPLEPPKSSSHNQGGGGVKAQLSLSGVNAKHQRATSTNAGTTTPSQLQSQSQSQSPRPKKRLRESSSSSLVKQLQEVDGDDDDNDSANNNAFYLKHQNRALSSELRQIKYQLSRLERERDVRRKQCSRAVLNLHNLQETWSQLEEALRTNLNHGDPGTSTTPSHTSSLSSSMSIPEGTSSAPLSTGAGTSVELMGAFFNALAALATPTNGTKSMLAKRPKSEHDSSAMQVDAAQPTDIDVSESDIDIDEESSPQLPEPLAIDTEEGKEDAAQREELNILLNISNNVSKRADTLQGWILSLLQRLKDGPRDNIAQDGGLGDQIHSAQKQVARLKAKNKTLKSKMQELARTRDEYQDSDRRVRRGLYRLASNRVQLKEVLKAIGASDEDKNDSAMAQLTDLAAGSATNTSKIESAPESSLGQKSSGAATAKDTTVSSEEVTQLKKKILDLEQITKVRDERIKTLLLEKEDQTKQVSSLLLENNGKSTGTISSEDVKKSDMYLELRTKFLAMEREVKDLREREVRIKGEWGRALATAQMAQKEIEELNAKHVKRWNDLIEDSPEKATDDKNESLKVPKEPSSSATAKDLVVIQHKLTQALENVRQAEGTRKALQDAVVLNNSLQLRIDEMKTKYAELKDSHSADTVGNNSSDGIDALLSTPKPKSNSSSVGSVEKPDKTDKSSEKLHKEYRKLQKQLAAAVHSKENAKAKLERAERERDGLQATNSRFLRQAAEKDEMNARSLSTILHLKQLTDQITKEKENLEQQVKSSQQLALSARLAANARNRLTEEFEKERQSMEGRVKEWETKCQTIAQEKDQVDGKMTQSRSRMAGLMKEVEGAKSRCEELASQSTKLQEEKQKMAESLAISQKEAEEARNLTEQLSKSSGGSIVGGFTAEQLHTQVKHLKSRVNCPVCNARDKKCILLRCRHMFCRNCVDENVKNRSRKCPACGIRFDTKDIADIWL